MSAHPRRDWKQAIRVVDLADRTPPHNLDLEASVLSTILAKGGVVLDELADLLGTSHWYADANRRVHAAALALHRVGQPVDLQTVAESLLRELLTDAEGHETNALTAIGGISYLAKLIDSTPAITNVRAHAELVVDLATRRRAIDTCKLAAAEGYIEAGPTLAWLDTVEQRIHDLAPARQTRGVIDAYDLMADAMNRMHHALPDAISTGLADVDAQLSGGLRAGEVMIIAGRPGMAKTSALMGCAVDIARRPAIYDGADLVQPRFGAMVFSMEMPKEQLADRMICSEARVDLKRYRNRHKVPLTPQEADAILAAASTLSQLPLYIDDTAGLTLMEVRAKVRKKQREFDKAGQRLGFVGIDYLQLMKGAGEESREQEISAISRGLKEMAKELKIPVVPLSQLNRAVETRSTKEKRPQLSDLRESGAIEQDADIIVMLYRPEYYITDRTSADARKLAGYAEWGVVKQRNGPTGRVPVTFVEKFARFENRDRAAYRDEEAA